MAPSAASPPPDSEILHLVAQLSPLNASNFLPNSSQTPTFPDTPLPRPADPTQAKTRPTLKPRQPHSGGNPPRSKAAPVPLRRKTAPLQGHVNPTPAGNPTAPRPRQPHSGGKPRRSKAVSAPLRRLRRSLGPIPRENYPPPKRVPSPLARQNPAPQQMFSPTPSELPRSKSVSAPTKCVSHTQQPQSGLGAQWDKIPTQQPNPTRFRPASPTRPGKAALLRRSAPTPIGKQTFPQELRPHFRAKPALPRENRPPHFCVETAFPTRNRPPLLWENPCFSESIRPTLVARLGTRECPPREGSHPLK